MYSDSLILHYLYLSINFHTHSLSLSLSTVTLSPTFSLSCHPHSLSLSTVTLYLFLQLLFLLQAICWTWLTSLLWSRWLLLHAPIVGGRRIEIHCHCDFSSNVWTPDEACICYQSTTCTYIAWRSYFRSVLLRGLPWEKWMVKPPNSIPNFFPNRIRDLFRINTIYIKIFLDDSFK